MISSWRRLGQVGPSCVKLILLGLFCPLVCQEFTEGFPTVLVPGYPEQDILQPFTQIDVQGFATVHQGVNDGGACGGIVVPAEQEILPAQGQRPDGILHKVVVDTEAAVVHIAAQPRQKDDRIGFLLTSLLQLIAYDAGFLRLVLDAIEPVDVGQRLARRPFVLVQSIRPLPPGMGPAADDLMCGSFSNWS